MYRMPSYVQRNVSSQHFLPFLGLSRVFVLIINKGCNLLIKEPSENSIALTILNDLR